MRIGTINVRGLAARRRQCQLSRLFLEHDLDLIAIQETKVETEEQTEQIISHFRGNYNVCVCHAVGTSGGCLLLLRNSLGIVEESVTACDDGRLVVCDFFLSEMYWRVVCVYAPNKENDRKVFFERVESLLRTDRNVILLGDFNCVCNAEDRVKGRPVRDKSALFLNELVHEYELEDVGSALASGQPPEYTHFQNQSHARLDRVYASLKLLPCCTSYKVNQVSFSDHALVTLTMGKKQIKARFNWDLWKFNAKLLEDETFVNTINEFVLEFIRKGEDVIVLWERFKNDVKMKAIERSSVLRHNERKKEEDLQTQLKFLLSQECAAPGTFNKQIKEVKNALEVIDIERYRGAMIRARAERLWSNETPTKRALGEEKRYAKRNEITRIRCGNVVTDDSDLIEREFVQHYRGLFSRQNWFKDDFENKFLSLMPKLDEEVKARLEEPISVSEIEKAIDELGKGKSPGPDGISAAFYKAFKKDLAVILHAVFARAYERKEMPPSFQRSHVVLIPKSDDPEKLLKVECYRPISLTNVDYKILMKILASRLQVVIKGIVGPHQTCGIKGRTIYTNIHVARSILEMIDALGGQVAMLQIDLEKAFDRVGHEVLFSILRHVNLGSVMIEGVMMAYKQCTASLVINKKVSQSFPVLSSVRQGCPLSPLLFAIYLEPFCLKILENSSVHGFRLQSSEVKILSYADDIAVFCEDTESVKETVKEASLFCKVTGSKINWEKCSGFWHGDWETTPSTFANVQWSVSPVKYLGVPLECYRDPDEYWKEQIEATREKTLKWGGLDLSIFARSTVCNVFLVAKVMYVLQALCMSRTIVQKLHRVFAVFLWRSTWERTSRTNLFRSAKAGGLGLVHLFLRQVVARFMFFRDESDPFLRHVMQTRLSHTLPEFVVSTSDAKRVSVRGFLSEVVRAVKLLKVRFSTEYLSFVTRKRLYKDLVDVCLPVPIYRSRYTTGKGKDVLKRVKKMPVRALCKTFFFQLHSGTLPVNPWLEEKGLFVYGSVNCRLCKKAETVEHIFLDCWDAIFHWDILQRTLKKDLPLSPYGIRYLPTENEGGVPYDMIMLLSLHSLWRVRMAIRHADVNARPVRDYFIECITYIREVYRAQVDPPEWITTLDSLASLKKF